MAKRWITYGAGAAFCMRYSCWVESLSTTKTTTAAAAAAAAALSLSLFSLLTRTYARQPVPALHLSLCEYSLSFSHSLSAWKTAALGIVVGEVFHLRLACVWERIVVPVWFVYAARAPASCLSVMCIYTRITPMITRSLVCALYTPILNIGERVTLVKVYNVRGSDVCIYVHDCTNGPFSTFYTITERALCFALCTASQL